MSGAEIIGLIFGATPLIISVLEHYVEGVSTVKRYLKYKNELQGLHRKLGNEYEIFINTCELLLNGIVHRDEIALMLGQPGGETWKKPHIDRVLQERLQRSYPV